MHGGGLTLAGVHKSFRTPSGESLDVLRDVSLTFLAGRRYAIQGRSGSGKSTLLSIVGLLEVADAGTYLVDGVDMGNTHDRERSRVRGEAFGFVFQRFFLVPHLTAAENVEAGLLHAGDRRPRRTRSEAVREALARVGLADRASHLPGALSGGEQQRVAIARALVKRPRFLLADEPSGALDEATADLMIDLLVDLSTEDGMGLVIVTHDRRVADAMTHTIRLAHGTVLE